MNNTQNIDSTDGMPLHERLEGNHWGEVVTHLKAILGNDLGGVHLLFHSMPTKAVPDIAKYASPHTVLILLGDESGRYFDRELDGFRVVFKIFLPGPHRHVHPVPLGTTNMQLYGSDTPIAQRPINVFFSGNLNANRVDFWRALQFKKPLPSHNIPKRKQRSILHMAIKKLRLRMNFDNVFPNSVIRFTSGFKQGMDANEYSRHLAESKICISPWGFGRAECFRHFEAMRAGSILITDKLTPTWYFKDSPIIQMPRWSDLRTIVNDLLTNPTKMQKIQNETIAWWQNMCSPEAIARYMADVILASVSPNQRNIRDITEPQKHIPYH